MESCRELYEGYIERIEGFVRDLLPIKELQLLDPWRLQLELLDFHREVQSAIREENTAKESVGKRMAEIVRSGPADAHRQELRELQGKLDQISHRVETHNHALRLVRCVGDAIAWLLLGGDKRYIVLHGDNDPHGNVPDYDAWVGMVEIAKRLSGKYGYPILHDLTNWLRTGDITFVPRDGKPICYEVKTKRPIEVEGGKLYVASADGFSMPPAQPVMPVSEAGLPAVAQELIDRMDDDSRADKRVPRHVRQLRRMHDATVLYDAEPNTVVEVRGQLRMMGAYPRSGEDFHTDAMRGVVLEAMRVGYASRVVDGACIYFAISTERPLWYPWQPRQDLPHHERLWADGRAGGLWDSEGQAVLYIHLGGTWDHLGGGLPPHVEPFILNKHLPPQAVMEILRGRLTVGVFVDLRKVVDALAAAGVDARPPKDSEELRQTLIPIVVKTMLPNGVQVVRNLDVARWLGWELVHQQLSLPAFVREIRRVVEQYAEQDRRLLDYMAPQQRSYKHE